MTEKKEDLEIMTLVSEIVSSYVSNNDIDVSELPNFIQQVHRSLCCAGSGEGFYLKGRFEPIVPIADSVHPDYIVCLEDGRQLKMLKRHLKTAYNLTPEQYREKWALPHDYPMVAPNYAKRRSELAKDIGLGTQRLSRKNVA